MKAKPKAKRTGKPKAKRAGTTRGAQTAQGAQVKQDAANRNGGKSEAQDFSRVFGKRTEELYTGAASFERWGCAAHVLSCGFLWAVNNGAGYDEILERPEMLRAVECLINDPPEIAQVFLMPNPNPKQGGAVCDKDCREWILATFRQWFEEFYTFGGKLGLSDFSSFRSGKSDYGIGRKDERGVWRWGDLSTMRFFMFPACLNLACFMLREVWADFTEKSGLPEFDELRKWLANDRAKNKRYYSRMGDLYDCAYSEEQYFDLNTGESNPPKYGGGGVRATDLLLSFRDYLRARQGVRDCEPVARPNPSAAQGANPSARDTANPSAAQGAAAGGCAANLYQYNREQVRRFISELPNDCALICDTVKNSLYDDGAGLLEDEELYKRLGRIAYIDNFIRYFGDYLAIEDLAVILNDLFPKDLQTAGAVDMKQLERVPTLDRELLNDILEGEYDDKTCFHNLALYYFSLWVNIHVGAVVSMFRKWVEVYGDNVPPVLRDMSALARCVCVYTRTEDNAHGGIFYDGSWFESFAMCGARRRKRNAEAARERDAAAARDTANPSEPVGNGAAQIRGAEMIAGEIRGLAKVIQAAQPNPPQGANPSKPKKAVISQKRVAELLKHYGGKKHGEKYTARTVIGWERGKTEAPTAGGVKYSADLRRDAIKARVWANNFNTENENAYKARKARV